MYCIILLIAVIFFTLIIKYYFKPFFIIIFLLALSTPIFEFFTKFNILRPTLRGVFSIILLNIIILTIVFCLGNWLFTTKDVIINGVLKLLINLNEMFKNLNINANLLNIQLEEYYIKILNSSILRRGAIYTTDSIINYFVGNIVVYFILVDKYDIFNWTKRFIDESGVRFINNIFDNIKNIIKIQCIIVIILTLETIIGFKILNIDNYMVLGLLCGVLDLMPYVGTILIFLPLILHMIWIRNYIIAFGLICLYILLLINRQIIETKLMSNKLKIHPLYLFLAVYLGFRIFGTIGIITMPLYLIFCKSILDI
ncbi:AI-2E family transporter [Clostridium malenominatum]|uniref:AI-2E family transporter n=1 Tax=Clostridium malenominatum TaxID=1539 RepID=UPI0031D479AD